MENLSSKQSFAISFSRGKALSHDLEGFDRHFVPKLSPLCLPHLFQQLQVLIKAQTYDTNSHSQLHNPLNHPAHPTERHWIEPVGGRSECGQSATQGTHSLNTSCFPVSYSLISHPLWQYKQSRHCMRGGKWSMAKRGWCHMRKKQHKPPLCEGLTTPRVSDMHRDPNACAYTMISDGFMRRQDSEIALSLLNQLFIMTVWFYFSNCNTTATLTTCLLLCYCMTSPSPII